MTAASPGAATFSRSPYLLLAAFAHAVTIRAEQWQYAGLKAAGVI
jgi:hypothetical protein